MRILVESLENPPFALVRLDDSERDHDFLQPGREVAEGDAVRKRPFAQEPGRPSCQEDHRHHRQNRGQRDSRIEEAQESQRQDDVVERCRRADEGLLDKARDRRAVLVDAEDGVADPGLAVVLQRQVFRLGDHRHAQVLVDHLPDPDVVVQEDPDQRSEHQEKSGAPDHGAGPDGLALRFGQKLALVDVVGDVVENERLVHEQQLRLHRLQLVAHQDLVAEQIRAEQSEGEQGRGNESSSDEEENEMLEHGPDERPALEGKLQYPPRADRRQIRQGLGARHAYRTDSRTTTAPAQPRPTPGSGESMATMRGIPDSVASFGIGTV